jgi:hypothetical protein
MDTIKKPTPAQGKLGILIPGLGAVATTLIAGVEAVKKGISQPIGSVTQMSTIRLIDSKKPKKPSLFPVNLLWLLLRIAAMRPTILLSLYAKNNCNDECSKKGCFLGFNISLCATYNSGT